MQTYDEVKNRRRTKVQRNLHVPKTTRALDARCRLPKFLCLNVVPSEFSHSAYSVREAVETAKLACELFRILKIVEDRRRRGTCAHVIH